MDKKIVSEILNKYHIKTYNPEDLVAFFTPLEKLVEKYTKKGEKILEIGCGNPIFGFYMNKQRYNIILTDISPPAKNVITLDIQDCEEFIQKHKKEFNLIYARLVFSKQYEKEHEEKTGKKRFTDIDKILSNIKKLVKKGGHVILIDDKGSIFSKKQFNFHGLKIIESYTVKLKPSIKNTVLVLRS